MGHAERQNASMLARKLRDAEAMNTHYLRALAALLIEREGEIRIPHATFEMLDPEMVVRQELDDASREMVFRLVMPEAATH